MFSIAIFGLYFTAIIANADIAIITNANVQQSEISKSSLKKIYLGKLKKYSNGDKIKPVDLPSDTAIHKMFYTLVMNKSNSAMNRYWSKLKYTGKGKPPKELTNNREIIKWVAATKGAVGYIDDRYVKYLKKSVKVVLTIP